MLKKLDHVSIAVENLDESIKLYGDMLGLTPTLTATVKDLGVKIALLPIGDNSIELIEPIGGTESRFAKHMREKGQGLFHLAIFAEDFDTEVKTLKEKGYKVEEEATMQLIEGFTVRLAWLSPEVTGGVWIEIVDLASLPPGF